MEQLQGAIAAAERLHGMGSAARGSGAAETPAGRVNMCRKCKPGADACFLTSASLMAHDRYVDEVVVDGRTVRICTECSAPGDPHPVKAHP